MASMKIKKGDMVKVIAGRDKDKEGKVIAVNKKDNTLLVEGVNMVTKHVKPRKMGEAGGLIDVESALYASKVQLVCPKCNEATRVGHKKGGARICKKCGNEF